MSPSSAPAICVGAVLFTDLVGFTAFNDAVGDAEALAVLDRQTAFAAAATARCREARLVKELGDGLMLWFPTATDGVTGATALLTAVDDARADGSFPLAMRLGLHHGSAIVRGDDLVGQTINIAARVAALAGPGELLVSDTVIHQARAATSAPFTPIGPVLVKGVQDPVWLHRYEP